MGALGRFVDGARAAAVEHSAYTLSQHRRVPLAPQLSLYQSLVRRAMERLEDPNDGQPFLYNHGPRVLLSAPSPGDSPQGWEDKVNAADETRRAGGEILQSLLDESRTVSDSQEKAKKTKRGLSRGNVASHQCKVCRTAEHVLVSATQTRGADESMTYFCSCQLCNSRWKLI